MSGTTKTAQPGLKRVLGLRELVIYGIILIQPTAAMPLYGVVSEKAHGHVVTTILIGMVAMLFTAISYGRMANAYPSAGSAYTYVGQELHPALGYVTGWAMVFDYVLNPVISLIFCSASAMKAIPTIPFPVWVIFFALLFTGLNLRGIKASARTNKWLAGGLMVVVVLFLMAAIRYIWADGSAAVGRFLRPLYDPETFTWGDVSRGTALAMLTYIGFDAISTLSEEAHNPRRNILLATVLTCLITAVLAGTQVYAGQLVWPSGGFKSATTAFSDIAQRAGGAVVISGYSCGYLLFFAVNFALLIAQVGSGSGAHLAAGRLLYGMGRDNAIPKRFFGAVHARTGIPRNNIVFVGAVALITVPLACFDYSRLSELPFSNLSEFVRALATRFDHNRGFDLGCEMLNFGALIGFMGVNLAAFVRYFVRSEKRRVLNLVLPLAGFAICLWLWCNLDPKAKTVGVTWLALGLVYGAWKTNGFRTKIEFAAPPEEEPAPVPLTPQG